MKTVKHNIVVVMGPSIHAYDVASKVGLMYLNRFCIDEEAAFELNGVYSIQRNGTQIFWNEMSRLAKMKPKDLKIHFIYTIPFRHFTDEWIDNLGSFILAGMHMYKIKTVMVTILRMSRNNLITNENMRSFCRGEKIRKQSVNDDLDSFFKKLQLGQEPNEDVRTYFLPKLTEDELELAERKDFNYFQSFSWSNPDVDESQMRLSKSDSKFVQAFSWRKTFIIQNQGKFTFGDWPLQIVTDDESRTYFRILINFSQSMMMK